MSVTAQQICDRAYQKIGLSAPTGPESTLAFNALNDMVSAWGTRFLVPYNVKETLDLEAGKAEYTVGSGGDLDTVRPMLINSAYLVNSANHSYPIRIISGKDYNRIGSKTGEGRPTKVYYYNEYSLVKLFFNKEADEVYTIHFDFTKNFTEFAAIGSTVELPSEYKEALIYNLTIKLAEDNSIDLPASVNRTATYGLISLGRLLATNKLPPKVMFDFGGSGLYDIENDI